jgi:hypothetical protein
MANIYISISAMLSIVRPQTERFVGTTLAPAPSEATYLATMGFDPLSAEGLRKS